LLGGTLEPNFVIAALLGLMDLLTFPFPAILNEGSSGTVGDSTGFGGVSSSFIFFLKFSLHC
jgi:hypothetical protein